MPATSTRTCRQTRFENSGANGAKARIISSGRVRTRHLFWRIAVTNVPYPLRSKMAKAEKGGVAAERMCLVARLCSAASLLVRRPSTADLVALVRYEASILGGQKVHHPATSSGHPIRPIGTARVLATR